MENRVAYKKMCTCVHSTSSGHPYREFRVQFHDRIFQLSEVQDPRNRVGLLLRLLTRVNLTPQDLKCGYFFIIYVIRENVNNTSGVSNTHQFQPFQR